VARCSVDIDYPKLAIYVSVEGSRGGQCRLPLSMMAYYLGVGTALRGLELSHHEGLLSAQRQFGHPRGASTSSSEDGGFVGKDWVLPRAIPSEMAHCLTYAEYEVQQANVRSHQTSDRGLRFQPTPYRGALPGSGRVLVRWAGSGQPVAGQEHERRRCG
jgi:hypothetical protein